MSTSRQAVAVVLALSALTVGGVAAVLAVSDREPVPPTPTRHQLEAYEAALTPLAKEGGFVVEEGLKFGLAQVERDEAGPVVFQAVGWVDELAKVRAGFLAEGHVVRGTQLEPAIAEFDRAFTLYIDAAETIGAAAIASGNARKTLVDKAAATGQAADARYDKASALLQQLRQKRGLPITARFPSPRSTHP